MADLPVSACIDLLEIEHPDFGQKMEIGEGPVDLKRMSTVDLFSGKEPYFFLQEFVADNFTKSKDKITLSDLRASNHSMRDKIEASDDFFDIPQQSNYAHQPAQPEVKIEEVKASGPGAYHPSYDPSARPPAASMPGAPPPGVAAVSSHPPSYQPQPQPGGYYGRQPPATVVQQQSHVYVNYNQRPPPRAGGAGIAFAAGMAMGGMGRGRGFRPGPRPGLYGRRW